MSSLDKRKTLEETANTKLAADAKKFLAAGELNPPFPYGVVPFDPAYFNMQAVPPKLPA